MLEVRLLGQFDVQRDHAPIVISSRLAQSLFAYLILTAGTAHRREKLAGLLWPDAAEEKARRNLRQELWRLRQAIEPKAPRNRPRTYFLVDEITLAFDPHSEYWLDAAILTGPTANHASAQALMDELALYRGELLPGFYDDWVLLDRERIHALFEQKIARLLDLLTSENNWPAVLDWAERWIALGQSPEPAYRSLMLAHAALGNRSQVGVVFERCVQALKSDLNVEPSPETRALFQKLATGDTVPFVNTPAVPPAPISNLPVTLTRLIGRERESSEVQHLLSATRLLTLTGTGGVGKTRLAIHVASQIMAEFENAIVWVELAPLTDGSLVIHQVAKSLQVREIPNVPLVETISHYLGTKHMLIVLDNCEHLVTACAQLAQVLLTACPNLKILATSREPLGITGEVVWRVPSLSVPDPHRAPSIDSALSSEGVGLFVDRARASDTTFQLTDQNVGTVIRICQQLDGIPLAIELAAARAAVLSPEQILARLDDRFRLLNTGSRAALPRHQTLRALVDWSFELLSDAERLLWQRLSVFAGGFTLDAVSKVCTGEGRLGAGAHIRSSEVLDLLTLLIGKSMVVVEPRATPRRYYMLETMRQYAQDRLVESGELDEVRRAHVDYFLQYAEQAEVEIQASEDRLWLDRLEQDHDNMRVALEWAKESGAIEQELRLVCALCPFWDVRSYLSEARSHLGNALSMSAGKEPQWPFLCAKTTLWAASMAFHHSDLDDARSLAQKALAMVGPDGDKVSMSRGLATLALVEWAQGRYASALPLSGKSLAICRELGDKSWIAGSLVNHGLVLREIGDYETARSMMEESLVMRRQLGRPRAIANALLNLGATMHSQADPAAAPLLEEALDIYETLGDKLNMARCLHDLGAVAARQGDRPQARSRFAASLMLFRELGDIRNSIKCLEGLGGVCAAEGDLPKAARLFGAAEALRQAHGTPLPSSYRANYDQTVGVLAAQLDKAQMALWWTEGRSLTIERAVEYAFEE